MIGWEVGSGLKWLLKAGKSQKWGNLTRMLIVVGALYIHLLLSSCLEGIDSARENIFFITTTYPMESLG